MTTFETPRLRRRLMCMVYEGLLLFGVLFFAMLIVLLLGKQASPAMLEILKKIAVFAVIGAYFIFAWCRRNGQTLPMKTWRIRLVMADGSPLRWQHALIRYLLCWMWFLPAIVLGHLLHLKPLHTMILLFVGMVPWALTVFLDRERQFLHDRLAGTRLISLQAQTWPPRPQ